MKRYTIKWYYGSYHGTEVVHAEGEKEAIRQMWDKLNMNFLPMCAQGEKVISVENVPSNSRTF